MKLEQPISSGPKRIVSLEPAFTELVGYYGLGDRLVGISHLCSDIEGLPSIPRVTVEGELPVGALSSTGRVSVEKLRSVAPELILCSPPCKIDARPTGPEMSASLEHTLGCPVRVAPFWAPSFSELLETFEGIARQLGCSDAGLRLAGRVKAQVMDWVDNFYNRIRNKRVVVIRSLDPFMVASGWVPELLKKMSVVPFGTGGMQTEVVSPWSELVNFRPDVVIVALKGREKEEVLASFKELERFAGWEDIPAVKRGEVFFLAGKKFMYASPHLLDTVAVLVSCIAGFDSGYITPRDSFYRLRWLELQRHKF